MLPHVEIELFRFIKYYFFQTTLLPITKEKILYNLFFQLSIVSIIVF